MSKVYQHKFLSDASHRTTVASSKEIAGAVSNHLERSVCRLNNNTDNMAIFATPLTADTIIIGNCSYNKTAEKNEFSQAEPYSYYHSYILSNSDTANLVNSDSFFLTKIDFEKSLPQKGQPIADTIAKLPVNKLDIDSKKISGAMLQNTFCSMMDIIMHSGMRYMSLSEPFSPSEIIGLIYSVLPLHAALAFSYVTFTADIPNVKYNLCFTDNVTIEHIRPQYRMKASDMFSGEQAISITAYPRLSTLIDQSSADIAALKKFYMFAYDFINIINKYSAKRLDPFDVSLYETLLCIYTYNTKLFSVAKPNLPQDIITALDFMDDLIKTVPEAENEIKILVPNQPNDENMVTITPSSNKAKRAERETALKIIALLTSNSDKTSEFKEIKSMVMREAQMGTFSLDLFHKILRDALQTFNFTELDDNQLQMAAYVVSLAFETVDYRIYGSDFLSYAPYDYTAMFDFITNASDGNKLLYKKMVSLHRRVNPFFAAASAEYKPAKIKKDEKAKAKAEKAVAKASKEEAQKPAPEKKKSSKKKNTGTQPQPAEQPTGTTPDENEQPVEYDETTNEILQQIQDEENKQENNNSEYEAYEAYTDSADSDSFDDADEDVSSSDNAPSEDSGDSYYGEFEDLYS